MPLLPRSWPFRSGGNTGTIHSTCSWQSPNFCLVWMEPDLGWITISPFSTPQSAGPPLTLSQPDRSRPLNNRVASDGGWPRAAPGSTLGGTGDQNSVSSGLGSTGACAAAAAGNRANRKISFLIFPSRHQFPMAVLDLAARTAGAQGIARQAEIGMTVGAPRAGPAALGP